MTNTNSCGELNTISANRMLDGQTKMTPRRVKHTIAQLLNIALDEGCKAYGPNLVSKAKQLGISFKLSQKNNVNLEELFGGNIENIRNQVIAITNNKLDLAA